MMTSSWLASFLPPPDTRENLTSQALVLSLLRVLLCYYSTAMLVLIPDTFQLRLALLPLTLWSAFRTITTVDLALTYNDPRLSYSNQGICIAIVCIAMRAIEWTFYMKPMKRKATLSSKESSQLEETPKGSFEELKKVAYDALDLIWNLRGIGWDWSEGLRLPPITRPIHSTPAFLLASFLSVIKHLLLADILQYVIQSFSPSTFGSTTGGTIFDMSLPPLLRYFRSSLITLLSGLVIYCSLQGEYDFVASVNILLFGNHPAQWPPLFYEPWRSTSLSQLWGLRWHQVFRRTFIFIGGEPLYFLFGPAGRVLGVFLVSGLMHEIGLWGMGRGTEFLSVTGVFLMMGVGVLLEGMWKASGRKVGGFIGWVWTMTWTIGWANLFIDASYRRGVGGCSLFPESQRPSKLFIQYVLGPSISSN